MEISLFIAIITSHTLFMTLFVSLFYFTLENKVEGQVIESQIKFLVENLSVYLLPVFTRTEKDELLAKLSNVPKNRFKEADKRVIAENRKIKDKSLRSIGIISIVSIIIFSGAFIIGNNKWEISVSRVLIDAFVTILFIASIEIVFLYFIAKNYFSIDPNRIKLKIISTIIKEKSGKQEN